MNRRSFWKTLVLGGLVLGRSLFAVAQRVRPVKQKAIVKRKVLKWTLIADNEIVEEIEEEIDAGRKQILTQWERVTELACRYDNGDPEVIGNVRLIFENPDFLNPDRFVFERYGRDDRGWWEEDC